jgi:hypothetical protein
MADTQLGAVLAGPADLGQDERVDAAPMPPPATPIETPEIRARTADAHAHPSVGAAAIAADQSRRMLPGQTTAPQSAPATATPTPPTGVKGYGPDGEPVTLPSIGPIEEMQGYRAATPEELHAEELQAKYGGTGQGLAAFGEGAASALTGGLSAGVETGLGVPAADIRGRAEEQGLPHALGTATGIIAPIVATLGAAAPEELAGLAGAGAKGAFAQTAELTAPALIARAGKAVAGAAGETGAGRLAQIALSGAAEGALYSTSDLTEKTLLGDPGLSWEGAAAELGLGALFGGALAGGSDVALRGLGKMLEGSVKGLTWGAEKLADTSGENAPAITRLMFDNPDAVAALNKAAPGSGEAIKAASPETAEFILKNHAQIAPLEKANPGLIETIAPGTPESAKSMVDNWDAISMLAKNEPNAAQIVANAGPDMRKFILANAESIATKERSYAGLLDALSRNDLGDSQAMLRDWSNPKGGVWQTPRARNDAAPVLLASTQASYDAIDSALKPFGTEIRPEETGELLYGPHTVDLPGGGSMLEHTTAAEAQAEGERVLKQIDWRLKTMQNKPYEFSAGHINEIDKIAQSLRDTLSRSPGDLSAISSGFTGTPQKLAEIESQHTYNVFQSLRKARADLDSTVNWGRNVLSPAQSFGEKASAEEAQGLREAVSKSIQGRANNVWGQAGVRQKALDDAYSEFFNQRKMLLSRLGEKPGRDWQISGTKIETWLNSMAGIKGKIRTDAFIPFTNAAKNLAREFGVSGFKGAPEAIAKIEQSVDTFRHIQQSAIYNQLLKQLGGAEIMSSGVATPSLGAKLAAAAAKKAVPLSSVAIDAAKKLPFGVGHVVGAATGTVSRLRNPAVTVHVLTAIDKLAKKASAKLSKGVENVFLPGAAGGSAAQKFSTGGIVEPERYNDVASNLRNYGGDLDRLSTQISGETAPILQEHAPATAAAAHVFAGNVVQHLSSKLINPGPRKAFDQPFEPSATELAAYNRHHEVASRGPVAMLEHMADGTVHPDHIAASQALYPRMHALATQKVAERLAEAMAKKEPVPRELRGSLGMLLGTDLDSSSTGAAILSAQSVYAPPPPAPQIPAKGPPKARNVETHGAERLATGSQGTLMRMGTG